MGATGHQHFNTPVLKLGSSRPYTYIPRVFHMVIKRYTTELKANWYGLDNAINEDKCAMRVWACFRWILHMCDA